MKTFLMTVIGVLMFIQPLYAAPEDEVEDLLKSKIDAVVNMLKSDDMSMETRNQKIMEIIEPTIDFELMAKLTLGKRNWSRLDASQQDEFVRLFVERLKSSYLERSDFYSNEEIVYGDAASAGDKIQAPVRVITGNSPIEMLYKFYRGDTGWLVYDVEINGVSLIRSYRSQFDEVLRTGTVEDLMEELRKKEGRIE